MGYEVKLLVGHDTDHGLSEEKNNHFFMVDVVIDMCKIYDSHLLNDLPWTNETPDEKRWYWYAPTGDDNKVVKEDKYGDVPQPVPLSDVIAALEKDVEKSVYRRYRWALSLFKEMQGTAVDSNAYKEFTVLLFGH
jgi:hypothetical protein